MSYRILVAEDHPLLRHGLRALLATHPDYSVVDEAVDGREAVVKTLQLQPDLVLMDISMPALNGLEATARIMKEWPQTRVLILSMHQNEEYVRQALRHGACAYMLKDAAPTELEWAIKTVLQGDTYLSPAVSKGVLSDYIHRLREQDQPVSPLTQRQREVLTLVAEGLSTKEIARRLDISIKTVDTHRSQLMKQLEIHEITGLVRYAMRAGLISPD